MATQAAPTSQHELAEVIREVAELRDELATQRRVIEEQRKEIDRQREFIRGLGAGGGDEADQNRPTCTRANGGGAGWTRRALLLGGVGAVAGVAATMAGASPAMATSGTMTYGALNNAGSDPTTLTSSSGTHVLRASNTGSGPGLWGSAPSAGGVIGSSTSGTGVLGDSWSGSGVVGMSDDSFGVVGTSTTGVGVEGDSDSHYGLVGYSPKGMAARFTNGGAAGPPASGKWDRGSVYAPSDGSLWWCVTTGTPGVWRMLAAPESVGAFVPVTPTRVYDSRAPHPSGGAILAAGSSRDISVANGRNLTTGDITVPNLVPAAVRAVAINLTVAGGTGMGTVALAPGGTPTYTASAVNFVAGQRIANGLTVAINPASRTLRAFAITASVHVIVDVTGYFR